MGERDSRTSGPDISKILGPEAFCSRKMYAGKHETNQFRDGAALNFHMDDWKHRIKVMIYLHDVDEDNGPFSYLLGSHRFSKWRGLEEFKFYRYFDRSQVTGGGIASQVGAYSDQEVDLLKHRYGYEELKVLAPEGTIIIFDSKGLHRGYPLKKGIRKVLVEHWKRDRRDGEKAKWAGQSEVDEIVSLA
jgi:ectoine hydroxylase-related dioxygenase (phytanoyl-CoA dioxygenase family)